MEFRSGFIEMKCYLCSNILSLKMILCFFKGNFIAGNPKFPAFPDCLWYFHSFWSLTPLQNSGTLELKLGLCWSCLARTCCHSLWLAETHYILGSLARTTLEQHGLGDRMGWGWIVLSLATTVGNGNRIKWLSGWWVAGSHATRHMLPLSLPLPLPLPLHHPLISRLWLFLDSRAFPRQTSNLFQLSSTSPAFH